MTAPRALLAVDVLVIGAGQAGLSSAHELLRAGLRPGRGVLVVDAEDGPGGAWRHRWPTLTMGRVNGVHDLPGHPLPRTAPDLRASMVVPAYFADYEARLALPGELVRRPLRVVRIARTPSRLTAETVDAVDGRPGPTVAARAVLSATGTWSKPFWPAYPGQADFLGRQLHTADYRGPAEFAGAHVVVVGGGISAVQHLAELAEVASTTWVTRSEPVFRDPASGDAFDVEARRAAVAVVAERVAAGEPVGSVASATGLPLTPEIEELRAVGVLKRNPMFARILPDGVQWADGSTVPADVVLWATGFRPALDHLRGLGIREPGGGVRLDGTRVVREPRLHLVGYGPAASTVGATRAARQAVRDVTRGR